MSATHKNSNSSGVIRRYEIVGHSSGLHQIANIYGELVTLSEKEVAIFRLMLSVMNDRLLSEHKPEFSNSRH